VEKWCFDQHGENIGWQPVAARPPFTAAALFLSEPRSLRVSFLSPSFFALAPAFVLFFVMVFFRLFDVGMLTVILRNLNRSGCSVSIRGAAFACSGSSAFHSGRLVLERAKVLDGLFLKLELCRLGSAFGFRSFFHGSLFG
jgi:hypothetical protein